jgi:hypothetical protein
MVTDRYDPPRESGQEPRSLSRWRRNVALAVFAAGAAYFLLTEHRAHTIQALPWLILLACPLMHVFMHGGHGSHGRDR